MSQAPRRRRQRGSVVLLYAAALLGEFRLTIAALLFFLTLSATIRAVTPMQVLAGQRPATSSAVYAAWVALLGQPSDAPTESGAVLLLDAVSPLLGLVLIGEGVVRFGLLMVSRRRGEKEWMKVMASTHRNHVILCGLGHLGYRILEQLLERGLEVVALERDPNCRFLPQAKGTGIPILVRDMKEDQALVDAGVTRARAIVIASNDDMANLEVALDARRMNPSIRVLMRMFDQQIATKIRGAVSVDAAFSASALAAPVVAAMVGKAPVLASFQAGGTGFLTAELDAPDTVAGRSVADLEGRHEIRVLALGATADTLQSPPAASALVTPRAHLVVGGPAEKVNALLDLVAD
jgi:voltage-gated potassium channel